MIRKWPYRCSAKDKKENACFFRRTLNKHLDEYSDHWRQKYRWCPHCGSEMKLDVYRKYKEHRKTKCQCDGMHYPHRKGCNGCVHHPDFNEEMARDAMRNMINKMRFGG